MTLKGLKMMLVDDDPEVLEAMLLNLRLKGAEVQTATDGKQAFELWRTMSGCQLVLSDVRMPGTEADGHTLARRIRASNPSIPIILASGQSDGASEAALAAGASAFVDKPFTWSELEALIVRLTSRP